MKKLNIHTVVKLWLLFCWTWFVLALTATPVEESQTTTFSITDKAVHLVLFGVFAYLLASVLPQKKEHYKYFVLFSFIASFLYAFLIEYIQIYIPGREASGFDLCAGSLGAIIGLAIYYIRKKNDKI